MVVIYTSESYHRSSQAITRADGACFPTSDSTFVSRTINGTLHLNLGTLALVRIRRKSTSSHPPYFSTSALISATNCAPVRRPGYPDPVAGEPLDSSVGGTCNALAMTRKASCGTLEPRSTARAASFRCSSVPTPSMVRLPMHESYQQRRGGRMRGDIPGSLYPHWVRFLMKLL